MATFNFELSTLPPEAEALRDEVRTFLKQEMAQYRPAERARSWGGFNRDFSRRMGERGWIGMTWPKKYGGHERTALDLSPQVAQLAFQLLGGRPPGVGTERDRGGLVHGDEKRGAVETSDRRIRSALSQ